MISKNPKQFSFLVVSCDASMSRTKHFIFSEFASGILSKTQSRYLSLCPFVFLSPRYRMTDRVLFCALMVKRNLDIASIQLYLSVTLCQLERCDLLTV